MAVLSGWPYNYVIITPERGCVYVVVFFFLFFFFLFSFFLGTTVKCERVCRGDLFQPSGAFTIHV